MPGHRTFYNLGIVVLIFLAGLLSDCANNPVNKTSSEFHLVAVAGYTLKAFGTSGDTYDSVSCSSADFCIAVGKAGNVSIYQARKWSQHLINNGFLTNDNLLSSTCLSRKFCEVSSEEGYVYKFDGSKWSSILVNTTLPDVPGSRALSAISCPTQSYCVTGGQGNKVFIYSNGNWSTAIRLGNPNSSIYSISCAKGSRFCALVDGEGNSYLLNDSKWKTYKNIDAQQFPDSILTSVSCPEIDSCIATDNAGEAMEFSGNRWSSPTSIDVEGAFSSLSCPSANYCVAVDEGGNAVVKKNGTWLPPNLVDASSGIAAVSCPDTHSCLAVANSSLTYWLS